MHFLDLYEKERVRFIFFPANYGNPSSELRECFQPATVLLPANYGSDFQPATVIFSTKLRELSQPTWMWRFPLNSEKLKIPVQFNDITRFTPPRRFLTRPRRQAVTADTQFAPQSLSPNNRLRLTLAIAPGRKRPWVGFGAIGRVSGRPAALSNAGFCLSAGYAWHTAALRCPARFFLPPRRP